MDYMAKTPNETYIRFQRIMKSEKEKILKSNNSSLLKTINNGVYSIPIYKVKGGKYLYCLTKDDYALLFENEEELNKMNKGKKYYKLNILFDKSSQVHCVFKLETNYGAEFIKNQKYQVLDKYSNKPGTEIYTCYLLENGNVCFLYERTESMKGGDWYENLETFQFYMKTIWNR